MKNFNDKFNIAFNFHKKNKIDKALKIYLKLFSNQSENFNLLYLIGTCYVQTKKPIKAITYLEKAIKINNNHVATLNNLAGAYFELNRYNDAIEIYQKLLKIEPNFNQAKNNLAACFGKIKNHAKAIEIIEQLLKKDPYNFEAYNNLGNIYLNSKKNDLAIINYKKSLEINPKYINALRNLGNLYSKNREYKNALNIFKKINDLDPNYPELINDIFFTKMKICDWDEYENLKLKIIKYIEEKKIIDPFILNCVIDNPKLQKKAAENYIENISKDLQENFKFNNKDNLKPKIAYFSGDFKDHPVMHLLLDVFKNQNNSNFDYYAFSIYKHKEDDWNRNLKEYFKDIIHLDNMSDKEVVDLSRKIGIDIAIDLSGFTENSRPKIFLHRCAPIQINFLGYPGTMGTKNIDYIIADKIVIPENQTRNYSEQVIYTKDCYQANINKREITEKKFEKKDFGLPEDSFVYCNFNTNYKITPQIFDVWLEILKKTKNTVLWILNNNQIVIENLNKILEKKNLDKNRIIFTEPLPINEHLKRIQLADLFLDTYPYGAHTTASDAIRMNLPIITIKGKSFPSRVASSILHQVELNDLVTNDIIEYRNLAVKIGESSNYFNSIRKKLANSIKKTSLFDSYNFTKNLENIYSNLLNNYEKN